ncbi:MarR family winged helix-turn-helix transcriptional regulator [Mesoterricola silvestris]|nr:MarR family transcriptional regulator [Mesoterricola silvestris]
MGSQPIPPLQPDARRVFDALRWIFRELRLAQDPKGKASGLSAAQAFVLHVLKDQGALSIGALAQATATDPSSVSVVVRKLQQKGLVGKAPSAGDRRRMEVALTAAGARAARSAPSPVQQALLERMGRLEAGDLRALADLLERVAPPVEDGHPAPMFFHEGAAGGRK